MKKLAIFGTGSSALRAWNSLVELDDFVVTTIVDNDLSRQGDAWKEIKVESAQQLLENRDWDHVVIASSWHATILRQLLDLGIEGERIAVFEPWASKGFIWGMDRWRWLNLFPEDETSDEALPGFEGDACVLKLLKQLGFRPNVILDVGASNGIWSVTCSKYFPESEYFLVEPLAQYEGQFVKGYNNSWTRLNLALSSEDGTADIKVPSVTDGVYDATIGNRDYADSEAVQSYKVTQAKFDTLLVEGRLKIPDLVKLDVQGFEAEVLSGASLMWGRVEVFMVELSFRRFWQEGKILHEMIALFEANGYLPFEFYHPYRDPKGLPSQIDCVFLKKDGKLARMHHLWNNV